MDALSALYTLAFVVWMPLVALRSRRVLQSGAVLPPKSHILLRTVLMLLVFGVLSIAVARVYGIPLAPRFEWRGPAAAAVVVTLILMLVTIPLRWRAASDELKRRLMCTRPESSRDLGLWILVSAAAALCEEITYRGTLFSVLWYATGSPWIAAAISTIAFALAHVSQGWRAVVVLLLFALAAHGIVWLSGSLYYAIALHFVYDVLAGVVYMRLARDLPPAPAPAPA